VGRDPQRGARGHDPPPDDPVPRRGRRARGRHRGRRPRPHHRARHLRPAQGAGRRRAHRGGRPQPRRPPASCGHARARRRRHVRPAHPAGHGGRPRRRAGARPGRPAPRRGAHRGRRRRPAPADPRRRVPHPDRPRGRERLGRRGRGRRARRGARRMSAFAEAVSDGRVVAWRNLKRIPRIPELAIFAILQSIMFVVLFAFVFGGAIPLPGGGSYKEYLMPGIYIQTLAFASITTAIGMADDMNKGLIDRFRSLPMARSAVLSGRTSADVVYNAGILVVLMLSGLVVGWRVHGTVGDFVLAIVLMLMFTFAMAWIGVLLGLLVKTVEVAQQLGFLVIF